MCAVGLLRAAATATENVHRDRRRGRYPADQRSASTPRNQAAFQSIRKTRAPAVVDRAPKIMAELSRFRSIQTEWQGFERPWQNFRLSSSQRENKIFAKEVNNAVNSSRLNLNSWCSIVVITVWAIQTCTYLNRLSFCLFPFFTVRPEAYTHFAFSVAELPPT